MLHVNNLENVIDLFFDSKNFVIIQKVRKLITNVQIYNPLSKNKDDQEDTEQPYEQCLNVDIDHKSKENISIEYLNKCGLKNGGPLFLHKVIDFAEKYGYKKIVLKDVSDITIYAKDENGDIKKEYKVSLYKFRYMKDGISWYGKFGFSNKYYEENKDRILKFIHAPLFDIVKQYVNHLQSEFLHMFTCLQKLSSYIDEQEISQFFQKEKFSAFCSDITVYKIFKQIQDNIYWVQIDETTTLSGLFCSLEKLLKTECKNNEFFYEKKETIQLVRTISMMTDKFYLMMTRLLKLSPDTYMEYIVS